jgi:hypothetical protein
MTTWVQDDGGRAAAGFKGEADDCVCRAVAIATGRPYREVYDAFNELGRGERQRTSKRTGKAKKKSAARTGVYTPTLRRYMADLGWAWTPTMFVGQGCKVHLRADELPPGRLVVNCSRHIVAVVDGVVHDNHDSTRDGTRCVYGYWSQAEPQAQAQFDVSITLTTTIRPQPDSSAPELLGEQTLTNLAMEHISNALWYMGGELARPVNGEDQDTGWKMDDITIEETLGSQQPDTYGKWDGTAVLDYLNDVASWVNMVAADEDGFNLERSSAQEIRDRAAALRDACDSLAAKLAKIEDGS